MASLLQHWLHAVRWVAAALTHACSMPVTCLQSRAIYGLDFMLEWNETTPTVRTMEPRLLEVNYCPDCVRACKYHPQFFNHMFQTLFDLEGAPTSPPVTRLL